MRKAKMTEFTFITANDIHISDVNPRSRVDDFKDTVLGKLRQMAMACKKLGADAAIIAGDLYNLKAPAKNSHGLNRELVAVFQEFGCPIYMIEGNHDLTNNDLGSIPSQPLGVLFQDRTLIRLRNEIVEKDGVKISLAGVPYDHNLDPDELKIERPEGCAAQICALHLYASPTGGMLFQNRIIGYKELAHLSPDVFIIGHYHIDQGIEQVDGKHFINIGSMSRGTLNEENIDHQPQIGYIKIDVDGDDTNITTRPIKLKVKPAPEVFDLEKREEEKKERQEIEEFVEKLVSETFDEESAGDKSIEEMLETLDASKEIKERAIHFLQEAQS